MLSFIQNEYNSNSLIINSDEVVDTSRNSDYFFITCDNFFTKNSKQIALVLERRNNRLAVVDNGCILFLIDKLNGRFNISLTHSINSLEKKNIKDLTNDGIKEIIHEGSERHNYNCSYSYTIMNFKEGKVNFLFEAQGTFYCEGELSPLSDYGYKIGDVMYEPIDVKLTDKNNDRIYEVLLTKSSVIFNGGESNEEIERNAIRKSKTDEVVLENK